MGMSYKLDAPIIVPQPPQYGVAPDVFERLRPARGNRISNYVNSFYIIEAYDPLTTEYYIFQFSDQALGAQMWHERWFSEPCTN